MNRRGGRFLPTVVSGRNGHSTRLSIYNNAEVPMYWVPGTDMFNCPPPNFSMGRPTATPFTLFVG